MPPYDTWEAPGHEPSLPVRRGSHRESTSRARLAPDDAYKIRPQIDGQPGLSTSTGRGYLETRKKSHKDRSRSRRKPQWKKLLWVEQQYPDNYTDEETFLQDLKRNPTIRQYEFWPLMADATVIIQHLCSVAIFVCCFTAIYQERVSPVTVVSWGSFSTIGGWILWDFWVAQEQVEEAEAIAAHNLSAENTTDESSSASPADLNMTKGKRPVGLGVVTSDSESPMISPIDGHVAEIPTVSVISERATLTNVTTGHPTGAPRFASYSNQPLYGDSASSMSPRAQQRLGTAKSALLIYCALLGLSPILKSLTMSTTSDSIWAMSCWLILINVAFFDYGGGISAKISGSLSTNAALMASTVLASRLPSTTHVFSLTLFSIEVFGLFPVFRRHLRHISWTGHLWLSIFLVLSAGGGVGVTVSGGGWKAAFIGMLLGSLTTFLAMGMCSWWLISLLKYKDEIQGPWDPARPILRRRWD